MTELMKEISTLYDKLKIIKNDPEKIALQTSDQQDAMLILEGLFGDTIYNLKVMKNNLKKLEQDKDLKSNNLYVKLNMHRNLLDNANKLKDYSIQHFNVLKYRTEEQLEQIDELLRQKYQNLQDLQQSKHDLLKQIEDFQKQDNCRRVRLKQLQKQLHDLEQNIDPFLEEIRVIQEQKEALQQNMQKELEKIEYIEKIHIPQHLQIIQELENEINLINLEFNQLNDRLKLEIINMLLEMKSLIIEMLYSFSQNRI
jgi:chromosome segregation ATPase